MNNYLLTVLVKENVDDKAREELLSDIKKNFGKLGKEDLWGMRELAYPIKHMDKAYYAHFEFESEPNTISALDKSLKLNEDVVRYLLLRNDPKKAPKKLKKEVKTEEVVEEKTEEV